VVWANWVHQEGLPRTALRDVITGGTALNDPSQGMMVQTWELTYSDPDVIVTPALTGIPITLFSLTGITEASIAFDQNMHPFVAYVVGGNAWYWWFDTISSQQEFVQMASDVINPRCTLDDNRPMQVSASDIILVYVRGANLHYRGQRERYTIERLLYTGVPGSLDTIGMNVALRMQFMFRKPL